MNPRLPRVTADQILRVLRRLGFEEVRSSGSHRILRNAEGKRVTFRTTRDRFYTPRFFNTFCAMPA